MVTGDLSDLRSELDRIAARVKMPRGAVLFQCGERVSGVFLIHRGTVVMSLDGADGLFPPRTFGPGEIVGLPATLTGTYSLTARVQEDAEFGFVPAQRVTDLFECSPKLCFLAMRLIGEEIARTRTALRDSIPNLLHEGNRNEA